MRISDHHRIPSNAGSGRWVSAWSGGPGELNGLADRSVPWVAVRREDYPRVEVLQGAERGQGLGRVAGEPGGHDLRADPAGQRIAGDQAVAGEQDSPGFEEQRGAAWRVAGDVHCTGFAGDVENLVVGECRHLPDRDDFRGTCPHQAPHRPVELGPQHIRGELPFHGTGLPGGGRAGVGRVYPDLRVCRSPCLLGHPGVIGVGVGQYHRVQVVQATPERVERSQEQLPVPRRAGIDERQAARLFDQVEVGNSTCEPMYPWGNFSWRRLWCVRHVSFLSWMLVAVRYATTLVFQWLSRAAAARRMSGGTTAPSMTGRR